MDVRPRRPDARDDAELVRAATAGDRGAFAAIYDRYADRLHDFCWSVLRDREEAADATQDAFLVAAERLGQLRDPERLRPWLYAVARSQAHRRIRARSRVAPEEQMTDLPDPASGPEQAAEQSDLRDLVWNAAAGLSERDRALLDLHLRHGLEGAELGEAMGVEPGHAYVLLTRLRAQVERSLGALLVARLGRDDCPTLSELLTGWDGRFSPLIRKRVARHVDTCPTCTDHRRVAASPLALLAAVPPLPAPAMLRAGVLERVDLSARAGSDGGGSGGSDNGGVGDGGGSKGDGGSGAGSGGDGAAGGGSASPLDSGPPPSAAPGAPHPDAGASHPEAGASHPDPGASHPDPGAPDPDPPVSGPPVGERSRTPGGRELVVHSPAGGTKGNGRSEAGEATAGAAGKRRRRGAVAAFAAALLVAVSTGVGLGWERSPAVSRPTDGQQGPIVAGPATSVATSAPPTTAAPSTSTSSSTPANTTTTAPLAPPSLAVSPARVDLGASGATATLTLGNGGDEPLTWTADPSAPWLRVGPSTGRLDGGERARLTVSATREGLPEGDAAARVELTWGGPTRSVAVALRVEHPPEISGLSATQPRIFTGPCPPTTTLVQATVTDESGLSSVTLRWGSESVPMTQRSGRWFAQLGPVASPGTVAWQVVATDDRGNTASAPGPAVRVLDCP